ncbi:MULTISPECIES: HPr kinase/phosphorylase [Marivita]|uniref:HPr kinase/phosphatase C-terminal domain-containing protein n=1 Tax=Marivita cryptomonadis TaxID=505252 RepID=A0A9Q2NUF3_9RHOB|nr:MULTISPECIES: HPr kinase/phosphatase C-terminal domain-containing protein [Marivita]MCR9168144.1 HPr kinase/phosphatase C-terminal domain-containing protein [Paracoccaceae bacterium]MBM2323091.1 HPr kinase/phosphatase C-terminal domain-containing protein [Marivita cryptomonadis]MBM2332674.1 HPr kinase/phosphatase C-terminal domain-containing protein [Marivita cryptomonadis]MBM2342257.1 HPr kinase/phosphatase C-terminal domain-containing protein [Marivita cryptomonadis]MBM2346922.1 HPr kinas
MPDPETLILHATSVAVGTKAVLITGESGRGKSALALEMMARGATLVADDQVILTSLESELVLTCPEPLRGLIEARGVGLLHAPYASDAILALVVDMDQTETERLPPYRTITTLSKTFPLLHNVESRHFPAAILQYLRGTGRAD